MIREQRRQPRVVVEVSCEITNGDELVIGETRDLSVSGACVLSDDMLSIGKTVWVTLVLTQDGIEDPDDDPFESSATVRWSQERPDGRCAAGLQFGPMTAAQKAQLERFLTAQRGAKAEVAQRNG